MRLTKQLIATVSLTCFALFVAPLCAQAQEKASVVTARTLGGSTILSVDDIRPGMKGVARTVFAGSAPEEFGIEIIGVLPGFTGPRQSTIIAKLSGKNVDRTGVFAGMSGSPVFIDGRLVGAIAYSFPFAKEPICGITPIEQMIDIFESAAPRVARQPRAVSMNDLARAEWKPVLPKQTVSGGPLIASITAGSPLAPYMGLQIQPIATPVVFTGISQDSLSLFSNELTKAGLLPVSGVGGAAAITPLASFDDKTLAPGTSVSVQLVRGDYSIAASGTVTFRDGERIYAFGHPFLGLGGADMPMTESSVITVIPNAFNSFKLANPGNMVGTISQDRATGIFGQLGRAAKMIPVTLNLHTSRNRDEKFSFEVVNDEFLTPLLMTITIFNSINARERSLGESTVSLRGSIAVDGQTPIELERRFSAANASLLAAGAVAGPISDLLGSGFDDVTIRGINLDISASEESQNATLERISLDRTEVSSGDTVEVQAYIRTDAGKLFVRRIPVQIPAEAISGPLMITVGDGATLQESSAAKSFVPVNLSQLVGAINKVKKNDRLYLRLQRPTPGVVIGTSELPNLPPSTVATLNSDRASGGYSPLAVSLVYERELAPAEYVISGQQTITVTVR
ncbi:MAG TPA: SpoIVB peptidase S55 domain-containing protein [Pyrinomonadaceae bacterium]|nr:SpoIVB peptidase S55 domain-containing protein [Pyrinomonadaceae bacterium]